MIGGLSTWQAQEILRGLAGIDLVGMDVVEVAPAYDMSEITALAAATLANDLMPVSTRRRVADRARMRRGAEA